MISFRLFTLNLRAYKSPITEETKAIREANSISFTKQNIIARQKKAIDNHFRNGKKASILHDFDLKKKYPRTNNSNEINNMILGGKKR